MDDPNIGLIFLSELVGTAMLVLLGCGVVANVVLKGNKGFGGGFLMINFGWGLAVFAGVTVSIYSGAHINPAVTFGLLANSLATGAEYNWAALPAYLGGQFLGAFLGAVLCWLAYKQHFDIEEDPGAKLGTFSTGPGIRNTGWNLITEIIGTFVLVFVVIGFGAQNGTEDGVPAGLAALGALPVALLVVGIGASLGGPTGYAINPARDLGPRIAHAVLPIRGKGDSDWGYSWIPVAGPIIGGVLAGLAAPALIATIAAA
ncbi:aquaporin family protein [Agrococcus sediminis]|uniref:Aquaporin family protein n=1 Tax=Agrococcus sediminis TaxID=2599924 RepID=A0A5M8QFC9_9MICO|nr:MULTISPECIES: MIP/aquaporin family protein [Agrococcus]KAA6433623.1 aquaporin family protein [Agrococcus sediminis]MDR7234768.1 glycerol uptake facilitator protein [Agrococcus sp. BE272]RWR22023.1 aquaporin family protein [Agrococcus lahaulensis]